jgi:cytochrome c oxidase cbb3-type subunit I/II
MYVVSMWASGITQGLMWRAINDEGRLVYPDFVETVLEIVPLYWVRAIGGTLFLIGFIIMLYNIWKTIKSAPADAFADEKLRAKAINLKAEDKNKGFHRRLEGAGTMFTVWAVIAVVVGSVIEIVPTFTAHFFMEKPSNIRPYSPLELAGRDLYIKEGCYVCHSQMIRPMLSEDLRYGPPSRIEESMWDHPFQWGSKRTGPDLARVGGKYPNLWHFRHMRDPREVVAQSIMPSYKWMLEKDADLDILPQKLSVMSTLGVPYTDHEIRNATEMALAQAKGIAEELMSQGVAEDYTRKEIVAIIAYMQRLGKNDLTSPNAVDQAGTQEACTAEAAASSVGECSTGASGEEWIEEDGEIEDEPFLTEPWDELDPNQIDEEVPQESQNGEPQP